jgi:hypothetical protein
MGETFGNYGLILSLYGFNFNFVLFFSNTRDRTQALELAKQAVLLSYIVSS